MKLTIALLATLSLPAVAADIDLAWDYPGSGTVHERFHLQSQPQGEAWADVITDIAPEARTFAHKDIPEGMRRYRLRACNLDGCSAWAYSLWAAAQEVPGGEPPSAPTAITITVIVETP